MLDISYQDVFTIKHTNTLPDLRYNICISYHLTVVVFLKLRKNVNKRNETKHQQIKKTSITLFESEMGLEPFIIGKKSNKISNIPVCTRGKLRRRTLSL